MITCLNNHRKVVYQCKQCGEPIREADAFYAVGDECYCENCIERSRQYAEILEEEDYEEF